jgi:hypothetical protein
VFFVCSFNNIDCPVRLVEAGAKLAGEVVARQRSADNSKFFALL